ncbi:MAG: inositol monophosphatase [Bdellovibrionales bacterium]|nr:inositol monophosphatase [Bdellovibrionales bacterium]
MSATELLHRRHTLEKILQRATPLMLEGYSATPGADLRRRERLGTQQKSSHRDLVTHFDKRVETFLLAEFAREFPGDVVVGEEGASGQGSAQALCEKHDAFWVLDPIDGTTNYSKAYPYFCTTAAYVTRTPQGYQSQVGAVWDPVRSELFSAARGSGAWLNRQQLKTTEVKEPREALLTTGFAVAKNADLDRAFALFAQITQLTLGVRRDGSAALDLAYVAAGRTDGYWERGLSPWDVCAGVLLIEEAGGRVTRHNAQQLELLSGEILASNGPLHDWLSQQIQSTKNTGL